jgi:hypothetical protein
MGDSMTSKSKEAPRFIYTGHETYGPIAFPVRLEGGGSKFVNPGEEIGLAAASLARATRDGFQFDAKPAPKKTTKSRKAADTDEAPP